jgi:hypothetical protein
MDIEGKRTDCVEASIIICNRKEILHVFHDHAYPLEPQDHVFAARHCHGIQLEGLRQLTNNGKKTPKTLASATQDFANQFPQAIILSADENPKGDIFHYTATWAHEYYQHVELPHWLTRIHETSHIRAVQAKGAEEYICGVKCHYSSLHHPHFTICHRKNKTTGHRRPLNDSDRAKLSSGSHCSLYDTYELFLFLQEKNAWPPATKERERQ